METFEQQEAASTSAFINNEEVVDNVEVMPEELPKPQPIRKNLIEVLLKFFLNVAGFFFWIF